MKYCSTGIKLFPVLSFFGLLFSTPSFSQNNTFSPYSRFGLGLVRPLGTPVHMGMGGTVATAIHPFAVNSANPASYAWLQKPTFDIGGEGQFINLKDNSGTQNISIGALNSLNFAFPMPRKPMCFSFGLRPFSSSGYRVSFSEENEQVGKLNYTYEGKGGISTAHIGMAYAFDLAKSRRDSGSTRVDKLSVGANVLAYFGSLENTARMQFTDVSYFSTRVTERTAAKDLGSNFGLIYRRTLAEKYENKKFKHRVDVTLGGHLELGQNVNAKYSRLVETYNPTFGTEIVVDTAFFAADIVGNYVLPQQVGTGISIDYINSKGRSIVLSLDARLGRWSQFNQSFEGIAPLVTKLPDRQEWAAGVQFTPRDFYTAGIGFFERINYRMGVRTATGTLTLADQEINESAVSAGLTIPMKWSGSRSALNLGTEVGFRGTTNAGLVRESFVRFNIGFTLTPYFGNQWFVQRKYD